MAGNDAIFRVPRDVRPGQAITAAEANAIRRALRVLDGEVRRRTIRSGAELTARRGPGGTIVYPKRREREMEIVMGLMPVARGPGAAGNLSPGVGVVDSKLRMLTSRRGTVAGGEEAEEVTITLGGTDLDADPPPRDGLAAGDWEAWVVYSDWEPSARIEFMTLGTGPGSLDRDEKAVRVASFSVTLPTETVTAGGESIAQVPTVEIYEQLVHGDLEVWKEAHMWRPYKTGDAKVIVKGGSVIWPKGLSDPLVGTRLQVADSAEITVTEAGSVWLDVSWGTSQQNEDEVNDGGTTNDKIKLRTYKVDSVASPTFVFRGATVNAPNPPVAGTTQTDLMTTGTMHFELFKVVLEGGEVQVSEQVIDGPIWMPEIVDASLENVPGA